ncbi:class I SAM-dependent methyltransferase [Paludibacter sp.]|uniref:class I SAM-dependent methyltransferase n=1 Tax=Paludibacter sp. TaxID=1898105 RepID=UPI001353673F|nr:class I SAM-dependent methyltransferase [Paludibacter sp.]MTK53808.1 class I SAM-dependent methyltransferase [Paludibacter sp.]
MTNFDLAAAGWDGNSIHWERSQAIANDIKTILPIDNDWRVLEYGAGTGILSFMLKDDVKEIVMLDSSEEMVKVMQQKVADSNASNLHPTLFNMEKDDFAGEKVDLIATQMVLHHVAKIEPLLDKFYALLNPGGYIAIADLYTEDGSFHGKGFDGHNGFDPKEMGEMLVAAGFKNPQYKTCFVMSKPVESGEIKAFPVFFLTAQK